MESKLCEPAATPSPVSFNRIDYCRNYSRINAVRKKFCAFCHCARNDCCCRCAEYEVEYKSRPVKIAVICKNLPVWFSNQTEKCVFTEKKSKSNKNKNNCSDTKVHQVFHDNVSRVFCTGKTCFDHCKSGLHPKYEGGA